MRMKRSERRTQLMQVALRLFSARGFDAVSVEEIASAAGVSKPVIYEHFGGKDGIYQAVVEHELSALTHLLRSGFADSTKTSHDVLTSVVQATFDYIAENEDGFRLLSQQSLTAVNGGSFSNVVTDVAEELSELLAERFSESTELDPQSAPIYAQLLAGGLVQTGTWWANQRDIPRATAEAHVLNFLWGGLRGLRPLPASPERLVPASAKEPEGAEKPTKE